MPGLSIPEFGPVASPITNGSTTPTIDAAWFVDFDELGPRFDVDLTFIAKADTFTIASPTVALWVSDSPTSIAGATALASVAVPNTSSAFAPMVSANSSVTNPGGKRYLLITSAQGSG